MENANVQDTPNNANTQDTSSAFEAPQVDATQGSSSELSVDDIILGGIDDTASAFGTPDNNVETTVESQETIADAKNDDTRYEYWQSQAAKKDNELEQLKAQQQQMMAMQQQMMQQPQAPAQPEPEVDKFPDAPTKPRIKILKPLKIPGGTSKDGPIVNIQNKLLINPKKYGQTDI